MRQLIAGDLSADPPAWRSDDKVGHLKQCVGDFRDLLLKKVELEREVDAR